jgi:hypothetical protein
MLEIGLRYLDGQPDTVVRELLDLGLHPAHSSKPRSPAGAERLELISLRTELLSVETVERKGVLAQDRATRIPGFL